MSGGKGGSKTTEKALPDWLRGPAERNLQRAEAVQQIEYMPYYGPEVAAFTPAQNAAFDANIGAAEAFGLLAPNTLTATSGMPTPTEWAGGFTGYSSQPLYDQALAELNAKQPGAVAQYNALFGNATPALVPRGGGGGSRFRGDAGGNPPSDDGRKPYVPVGNQVAEGVARGDPKVPFSYAVDPIALREGRLWADSAGVPDPIKMRQGSIYKTPAEIKRQTTTNTTRKPVGYGVKPGTSGWRR